MSECERCQELEKIIETNVRVIDRLKKEKEEGSQLCQKLEQSLLTERHVSLTQQHTADYWFAKVEMIRYILNCHADEFYELRAFVASKKEN